MNTTVNLSCNNYNEVCQVKTSVIHQNVTCTLSSSASEHMDTYMALLIQAKKINKLLIICTKIKQIIKDSLLH